MNNQTEFDVRRAILSLDISSTDKLVLLSLLIRVDWKTFSGSISVVEIASMLNMSHRSVQRSMKTLKTRKYISRFSEKIEDKKSKIALTQINSTLILKSVKSVSDKSVTNKENVKSVTDKNDAKNDKSVANIRQECREHMTDMTPYSVFYNNNNIYNKSEGESLETENDKFVVLDEDKNIIEETEFKLTEWQIKAIENQVKKSGDQSFANRKRIAKRLFKVKLKKGGYYEKL